MLDSAVDAIFQGTSAGLVTLATNPYNPLKGATSRPDPLFSYTWYMELPGYDFGAANAAVAQVHGWGLDDFFMGDINSFVSYRSPDSVFTPSNMAKSLGGIGKVASNVASGVASKVTGLPWNYVEQADLPFRDYSKRSIFRNGHDQHYPRNYTVGDMNLRVYADCEGRALRYLNAWHNAPMRKFTARNNGGGAWAPPARFKRSIDAVILSPKHSKVAIISYVGCWLTSFSPMSLGSDGAERTVYSVNISVDDVFVTIMGVQGLINLATPYNVPL